MGSEAASVRQSGSLQPPSALPAELTSFIGRRQELGELRQLLGEGRLVTLTGIGGVGKTRLALRLGATLRRAFADGVWLIDLSGLRDPTLLPDVVLQALGLEAAALHDPVETLVEQLSAKQTLLIIDNCEHVAVAAAEFMTVLLQRAPRLRMLATSRHTLKVPGEQLFPVAPLAVPPPKARLDPGDASAYPAIALFAERATAAVPGFELSTANVSDIAALCRALDGLPLAIELAAVRLRVLSPTEMAARLVRRLQVLSGVSQPRPARHVTLRAVIEGSYELCTPAEQSLWACVSVFAGGFDLAAAEEVCSGGTLPREAVIDTVAGLVEKSILVREEGPEGLRFRILEVLRDFGHERLPEHADSLEIRRRHRDWCTSVIQDACARWFGPDQETVLAKLRSELANIRSAIDFSFSHPEEVEAGLHLVGRAWFLWSTLVVEGRQWLERAIAVTDTATTERARVLATCAIVASIQGDTDAASLYIAQCKHLVGMLGDEDAAEFADHAEAIVIGLGQPRAAADLLAGAPVLDHSHVSQDAGIAVTARLVLATAALLVGELDKGSEQLERCIELCEWARVDEFKGYAHWGLAFAALLRGEHVEALSHARTSLSIYSAQDTPIGDALDFDLLGWIHVSAGRPELGAVLIGVASGLWHTVGRQLFGSPEWMKQREQAEAAARISLGDEAFELALERGQQMPIEDAIALALDKAVKRPATSTHPQSTLTRREAQVASLLAEGLSNKEISQRLVISVRTAETHVERILAKLGLTSRSQVAQWARTVPKGFDGCERANGPG